MEKLTKTHLDYINNNHTNTSNNKLILKNRYFLLTIGQILVSLIAFTLGVFLLLSVNTYYNALILSLIASFILIAIIYFFTFYSKTNNKVITFLGIIGLVLVGIVISFLIPNIISFLFRLTTGVIGLIMSGMIYVNVWRFSRVKTPYLKSLIFGTIYLIISIAILIGPYSSSIFTKLVGIYLILLSFSTIYESINNLLKNGSINDNLMVSTPAILSFFIPIAIYSKLNSMIRKKPDKILTMQEREKDFKPDLEVYFHVRSGFILGFGHVDLCFNDKVYSFGDYDHSSTKLGGLLSDGVVAIMSPDIHINYELKDNKKMIVAYGFKLSEDQKKNVQEKLDEILANSYEWSPEIHNKQGDLVVLDPDNYVDDGSRIFMSNIAHYRKFNDKSIYKLYYGVGENCSKFVNDIMGVTGIKLKSLSSIITPGSLLAYLEKLYNMDNTVVKERRLYSLDNDGVPLEYPDKTGKAFKLDNIEIEY